MIMTLISYLSLIYIFLKTVNTPTELQIRTLIIYTSFMFGGFVRMLYTIFIIIVLMYSKQIPTIFGTIKTRYNGTKFIVNANKFVIDYNLQNITKYYLMIGDIIYNLLCTLFININNKIREINPRYNEMTKHVGTMNMLMDTETIDDYIDNNDDEHLQKLNSELDNLLKLGSNILTQTMSGKKSEQKHNVNKFMNDAGKLFQKNNVKKNE